MGRAAHMSSHKPRRANIGNRDVQTAMPGIDPHASGADGDILIM